ncbi:MAG: MBL fold metallo-hydrolase [Candidatus Riflebacteria bacterium]|nr:MBL fold metallo-hydrolase [Candidatus Riflebacteria bacterium]
MKIGPFEVSVLVEGSMYIDGGSVFGTLPRKIWEKQMLPDTQNRVRLGLRQLLVQSPGMNMLIDTGVGEKLPERIKKMYGIELESTWEQRLAPHELTPDQITHIIFTHLHLDHSGGATQTSTDGTEVFPTFPNARHFIQEIEWRDACSPNEHTRRSYLFENFLPLQNEGKLQLLSADHEIVDGIHVFVTGGHTHAHQMVIIGEGDNQLFVPGDLCPTFHHISVNWQNPFDLYPVESLQARKNFLSRALNTHYPVFFNHDPDGEFRHLIGTIADPVSIPYS